MFAVVTRIKVNEGSIPKLAALFEATNHDLVARHDDWLGAWFTANHETSEITVIAHWAKAESYGVLRDSDEFKQTMSQFATKFAGPPVVSINEILVKM